MLKLFLFILLKLSSLKIKQQEQELNGTYLVWVFDVDAEAQLLQHTPFSFYHLVFGVYVVLIKYQWTWTPDLWRNESKIVSPDSNIIQDNEKMLFLFASF